jgi:hypothetical protein
MTVGTPLTRAATMTASKLPLVPLLRKVAVSCVQSRTSARGVPMHRTHTHTDTCTYVSRTHARRIPTASPAATYAAKTETERHERHGFSVDDHRLHCAVSADAH